MKKTLFSAAFVAASGIYVAAANHLLPFVATGELARLQPAVSPAALSTAAPTLNLNTALPRMAPVAPVSSTAPPTVAEIAPVSPAPTETESSGSEAQTVVADPAPPLPRPRPTPLASAQLTAATDSGSTGYRDGTYTGSSENAYYGRVQVRVTIASHQLASVKVLDYPSDRRTSRYINSQALPMLQQEVIAADGASVDTISGATLTSNAYIRSLATALQQAGGAGA